MNCKLGDLAIVVGAHSGEDCKAVASRLCLGRIVRVAKYCSDGVWDFEEPINLGRIQFVYCGMQASGIVIVKGMPDSYLRPVSGLPIDEDVRDEVTA